MCFFFAHIYLDIKALVQTRGHWAALRVLSKKQRLLLMWVRVLGFDCDSTKTLS